MVADLGAGAVEDEDPPGPAGRGDAVRDHDERAAAAGERGLRLFLRGGVEMAGGLVEDDDRAGGRYARVVVVKARAVQPDVALLAAAFPDRDGITVAAELRAAVPDCRCAILSPGWRSADLQRAAAAGVRGFLVWDSPAQFLTEAVRQLAVGRHVVDPRLSFREQCPLTTREADALRAAAEGSTTADIATRSCACPKGRCATTCPARSRRPARATASAPSA